MAEGFDELRTTGIRALNALITGQQAYYLEVPGTDSAAALSVVSFEAVEGWVSLTPSLSSSRTRWRSTGPTTSTATPPS